MSNALKAHRKKASRGPYRHRRAQAGKPNLHRDSGGRAHRADDSDPAGTVCGAVGRAGARILLEVSTESEWVAQCLEACGHEVIVADPNYAPMYPERRRRVKTNRRDARTLATACRLGAYRPAHRVSAEQRRIRHVRRRSARKRDREPSMCGDRRFRLPYEKLGGRGCKRARIGKHLDGSLVRHVICAQAAVLRNLEFRPATSPVPPMAPARITRRSA